MCTKCSIEDNYITDKLESNPISQILYIDMYNSNV